jgi:hypothetical protein
MSNVVFAHPHGARVTEVRSYSTEANLVKGLERLGFAGHRHLRVCTDDGRCTAVFPASNFSGGWVGLYAQQGFMTLG